MYIGAILEEGHLYLSTMRPFHASTSPHDSHTAFLQKIESLAARDVQKFCQSLTTRECNNFCLSCICPK